MRGKPVMGDRAGRVRAIARWVLPYGIQLQLRQARSRRKALREPVAEETQMSEVAPPRRCRHDSRSSAALDPFTRNCRQIPPLNRFRDAICRHFSPREVRLGAGISAHDRAGGFLPEVRVPQGVLSL